MSEVVREIMVCPECNYVGSAKAGTQRYCPICGMELTSVPGIEVEEWRKLSAEEKAALKKSSMLITKGLETTKGSEIRISDAPFELLKRYLSDIRAYGRTIRGWVRFFGIMLIIFVVFSSIMSIVSIATIDRIVTYGIKLR